MPKGVKSPTRPVGNDDVIKLAEVVKRLTQQVQHLAMILDEIREDLVWAVRNDKFTCPNYSQTHVASVMQPDQLGEEGESEPDETSESVSENSPTHPKKATLFNCTITRSRHL